MTTLLAALRACARICLTRPRLAAELETEGEAAAEAETETEAESEAETESESETETETETEAEAEGETEAGGLPRWAPAWGRPMLRCRTKYCLNTSTCRLAA